LMRSTTKRVVAMATAGAERKFRMNPVQQVRRIKHWAKEHGWRVARGFYFGSLHPVTRQCAIGLAIDAARKADAVIVVLDSAGQPTVLRVERGGEV